MKILDDKLKEVARGWNIELLAWQIAQIKQALADEGYSQVQRVGYNREAESYSERFPEVMTGAEWYERFKKELNKLADRPSSARTHTELVSIIHKSVEEAARKASVLDG